MYLLIASRRIKGITIPKDEQIKVLDKELAVQMGASR